MRIGIDARILGHPTSGIAVYTINLVDQFLKHKDLEIVLFGDRPICEEYKYITDKAQTVIFGQNRRKYWAQFYLPSQLKKHRIDLYHATWNNAVPIFTNVPRVLTVHDIIPLVVAGYFKNWRRKLKYVFSMRSALRKAKIIITDAENTKADLIKYFRVPLGKIKVIYLGIKQDFLSPHLNPLPLKGGEAMVRGDKSALAKFGIKTDYIINIGSFDKRRNVDTLLKAFAIFINNQKFDCQLVLTGGYDNFKKEMDRIKNAINGLGLSANVVFTNYVLQEDMPFLLSKAKMMVHLSLYEGFCLPVLEAMACGVPVIASDAGSIPEVAGDAAVLVDAKDIDKAARAIGRLWSDTALAAELIKKGYDRIKKFSWQKTAEETIEVYEKIS